MILDPNGIPVRHWIAGDVPLRRVHEYAIRYLLFMERDEITGPLRTPSHPRK